MIKQIFGIKNDGILVATERIKKYTYTKYPPESKYILWQNIKLILLLIILTIICNITVAFIDKNITIPFIGCDFIFAFMICGVIWETRKEWKNGKYWTNN